MKQHAAEHARIRKNQLMVFRRENEVVVLRGRVVRRLDVQVSAHAEMNSQTGVAAESKEHLFRLSRRAEELSAGQSAFQCIRIGAAEHLGCGMHLDCEDLLSGGCEVPPFAEKFYKLLMMAL